MKRTSALLARLLPQSIDNTYRGHKLALWLFGLVVGMRIVQSILVIGNGYPTARDADGIPMDTFPPAAAQAVVALFAQGSLWRLTFGLFCGLVLLRYRSAVSLMFGFLLLNYLAAQLIFQFVPLGRIGTPPGPILNAVLFVLTVVGFTLSVWPRRPEGIP